MPCQSFFKNVMEVVIDAPYTVTESLLNRFKVILSLLLSLEPVHEISMWHLDMGRLARASAAFF